jgi:dihydroxyacetone kinase-like predicted kinase
LTSCKLDKPFLVAEQNKLQHHIKEIDESIRIISELSNGQLHVHNATPQPPNMVAESLRVFHQQFGRDPDHRNEMVEFRLG